MNDGLAGEFEWGLVEGISGGGRHAKSGNGKIGKDLYELREGVQREWVRVHVKAEKQSEVEE